VSKIAAATATPGRRKATSAAKAAAVVSTATTRLSATARHYSGNNSKNKRGSGTSKQVHTHHKQGFIKLPMYTLLVQTNDYNYQNFKAEKKNLLDIT
jgi:hypothetical protein